MGKTSVTVLGATGYAGAELVRLLERHPFAEVVRVTSTRNAGRPLRQECPWLATDLILEESLPAESGRGSVDSEIVFLCQETGFAMERARHFLQGSRVIDLSADFRLKDPAVYEEFYNRPHCDPELRAVYGLPELVDRYEISEANLIANPGCYPTASLLALAPLLKAGLVHSTPIIDAKSGVSGAGRSRKETDYLFAEIDRSFKAYGVVKHRHTPEIEQLVGRRVRFTPHLVPMARGIHATAYVEMERPADLVDMFQSFYAGERFVQVQTSEPTTKQVLGSNTCAIAPFYDDRTGFAVVCSVIDNLVKGAAGQAIQNMNLILGAPEDAGLPTSGIWP